MQFTDYSSDWMSVIFCHFLSLSVRSDRITNEIAGINTCGGFESHKKWNEIHPEEWKILCLSGLIQTNIEPGIFLSLHTFEQYWLAVLTLLHLAAIGCILLHLTASGCPLLHFAVHTLQYQLAKSCCIWLFLAVLCCKWIFPTAFGYILQHNTHYCIVLHLAALNYILLYFAMHS